jgi:hypothetical protein
MASLTIGGVLLAAMICIAVYGWVTLPAGARVPVHHGRRYNTYTSKTVGLIAWPVAGAVIYVILIVLSNHASSSGQQNGSDVPLILIPIMLLIMTIVEYGAISVARKNARSSRRIIRSPRRSTRSARR